jgi:hypothetical protein
MIEPAARTLTCLDSAIESKVKVTRNVKKLD